MAGGSLNLASIQGTGDDILSINPQITFFKKVYKRHTNFGLETREITTSTNSSVNFGQSVTYTIDKSGSLINNMYIEFTLPPAINTNGNDGTDDITKGPDDGAVDNWDQYCCWVNAVGFAILNEVKLEIDGNTIDKHNGLWYDIWNELTDINRKEWSLVGKRDDTETPGIQKLKSRYYVPLKFYFNRNAGLSLPIFLFDDNKIKISLTLNSLASLLTFDVLDGATPVINDVSITKFKFFTNYVFLDTAEQNKISNNLPTEYLIETLDIKDNLKDSDLSKITLNNPVKELLWVIRHKDRLTTATAAGGAKINNVDDLNNTNPNNIFNYSLAVENTNLGYGTYDTFKTLKFSISNQDRIQETDATHFRTIQPYNHHSNIPGGYVGNQSRKYIYSYSFAINPEEYQPSGSYNFTKADDDLKMIFTGFGNPTTNTNEFDNYRLDLFAFHYKYLSINQNGISFKDVPYSSNVQVDTLADSPEFKGVDEAVVKGIIKQKCKDRTEEALIVEEKRLIAIEAEVRRRYSERKPDAHNHQNFTKKKWSGFQKDYTPEK
jgi:hypothetical protein